MYISKKSFQVLQTFLAVVGFTVMEEIDYDSVHVFVPQVEEKMCATFAMKVEKQLTHPKRRQVIFELLGSQFVDRYFPEMENDPNVLVRITKHRL